MEDTTCFQKILSWRSCVPDADILKTRPDATSTVSTFLTLPPLPVDSYISESQTDTWTRTGWTKAHIRHLFDATLTWDYLPFCLLRKDLFMRDYESGSSQFCSSSLVHATLAISSRLINENDNNTILPSGWLGSKFFFDEANRALQALLPAKNLPDIQALGVLSLYQMRCGLEGRALGFAKDFARNITELCNQEPRGNQDDQYINACAITYCRAVSLVR